jgi:hypothetical protein
MAATVPVSLMVRRSGPGSVWRDSEAELLGEGADELDGGGVGTVALTVLGVGETLFAGAIGGLERGFALDDDGDGDFRAGGCGLLAVGLDEASFFAARQNGAG